MFGSRYFSGYYWLAYYWRPNFLVPPDKPGIEYTGRVNQLHFTGKVNRLHYTANQED